VYSWTGYKEGIFSIQDEASQLLPLIAAGKGGEDPPRTILDVCAGLGGKTFGLMNAFPGAQTVALDRNPDRLRSLNQESKRLRLPDDLRVVNGDILDMDLYPKFDLVAVDAPCSGLGVMRRRPDLKWKKTPSDVYRYANIQLAILMAATRACRPGGRLVYGVCSMMNEEGPDVVKSFLEQKGGFCLDDSLPESLEPARIGPGQILLLPHKHGTDGFYYASFKRME
jgi:16S rRNA (cytosine967-C5)-methyltransferase